MREINNNGKTLMKELILISLVLVVFISGCATQYGQTTQPQNQPYAPPQEQQPVQESPQQESTGQGTLQGEVAPSQQPSSPIMKEFTIEADDRGFYMDGQSIFSVSVNKSNIVKITYQVRLQNVYYGGLDFRGCGQISGGTKPGGSTTIQFTADSTCTITSYWPASNVIKDSMQVIVA